jgi:arylformamidase
MSTACASMPTSPSPTAEVCRVRDFRLDIPSDDITEDELATVFVRHLGLLMVSAIRISGKTILREPHKGSRGVVPAESAPPAPGRTRGRRVELSHVIRHGMVTYPGLPGPEISDHLTREASRERYEPGTEFHIGRVSIVANTGTYVDVPAHRFADGADLSAVPLDRLVDLDGLVVRPPEGTHAVDPLLLAAYQVRSRAVLIHTGWDRHWGPRLGGQRPPPRFRHPLEPSCIDVIFVDGQPIAGGERVDGHRGEGPRRSRDMRDCSACPASPGALSP